MHARKVFNKNILNAKYRLNITMEFNLTLILKQKYAKIKKSEN
jgi:hypothetical protein